MPKYSNSSAENLGTCHPVLQRLFLTLITDVDHTVLCGFRNEEDQNVLYPRYTKVQWPDSNHNHRPSLAVDVAPYPIVWDDTGRIKDDELARARFYVFAGHVKQRFIELQKEAKHTESGDSILKYKLIGGFDWDGDGDFTDQEFNDLPHWEIRRL